MIRTPISINIYQKGVNLLQFSNYYVVKKGNSLNEAKTTSKTLNVLQPRSYKY